MNSSLKLIHFAPLVLGFLCNAWVQNARCANPGLIEVKTAQRCANAQEDFGEFGTYVSSVETEALWKREAQRYEALTNAMRTPPSDPNIDVTYYKLDLVITAFPYYLRGRVTVKAVSMVGSLSSVTLDFMNTMTVDSVKTGNVSLSFSQQTATMAITLDRSYGTGEAVTLDIYYQGVPVRVDNQGLFFRSQAGVPLIYSISEPWGAKSWWPCKDHPSDKADSADIWITCDTTFKVGSNGTLVDVVDNGNGTHTYCWSERYPITTYLISVAMTNYAEFSLWFRYSPSDSMEVLNYVFPEHLDTARANFPRVIDMLTFYSNMLSLYPFINEKYGHAEILPPFAMEHQTMTSTSLAGLFYEPTVAHELAHMWFGDMITCANWPNIWLNEGFATYCEALYVEAMYGTANYWDRMNLRMAGGLLATGTIYVQDTSRWISIIDPLRTYHKAACVLHMLRHVLGDSIFFRAMKSYAEDPRYRFNVATTEDFQAVCEQVSGTQLGYFFDEWIYGELYPRYTYSWYAIPDTDGGYIVPIRIQQTTGTANPPFFVMPVDFRLSGNGLDTTVVLMDTLADQTFLVHVPVLPTAGELDPNNWILKTAALVSLVDEGLDVAPQTFRLEQSYPNPFNPSTTITYQLPTRSYVTLKVFDVLGREVATLVNELQDAGYKSVQWDAASCASGLYLYRLQAGSYVETRKMVLVR